MKYFVFISLFLIASFLTYGLYTHADVDTYYVITAILWLSYVSAIIALDGLLTR